MKRNIYKRIGALLLSAVMVFSVGSSVFADDDNVYTGVNQTEATSVSGTTSIPLNKTIVIFNTDDDTAVREPDITFSYALAPVNSTAAEGAQLSSTVNDGTNTVRVYNGVTSALNEHTPVTNPANITFSSTKEENDETVANTVAATTKGYEDEKTTNIGVDPEGFPHAGIYRYKITETSNPASVADRGLEAHTSYDSTRYLDIYIYNPDYDATTNSTGHKTLWMGAAVIFKTLVTTSGSEGTDNITTTFEKTTGFEPGLNGTPGTTDFTGDATVDRYFTYNLDVTKAITGTLADKTHDFPFQIAITGALANAVTVDVTNSSASPANTTLNVSTTVANDTAALRDGETYSVTGLPKGTTVTVTEYNDTVDVYKLTTSFAGTSSTATQSSANEGITLDTATGETGVLINSGDASTVKADTKTVLTFTNNLETISPTGVIIRFAPYVLMFGVAFAIFVLLRRHDEDEV